jgi:hypothetical protein
MSVVDEQSESGREKMLFNPEPAATATPPSPLAPG